ncbi:MAG: DNA-3-methyladenine glycosylase 2 family protein, partial [Lachnospiraceae bacterium]|nr:DNA-3-methyladenine glycosylase 2 family protein [Lachnospiraceae bacterium]
MISKNIKYFDLRRICSSGQIFRMYEREDGIFDVYSGNRHLRLRQQGGKVDFYCDWEEFDSYWRRYFDLDRDYEVIVRAATGKDELVEQACQYGAGIRILHQDIWEMLISFIISQQKQIPSIRKCIEALCERFGERKCDTHIWYTFPTAEAIATGGPEGMKGLSLGYRERYISETAVKYLTDGLPYDTVESMGLDAAKAYFTSFCGVGEKVANCICLFGAGYVDAFPIDTHIKDILYREYYLKLNGTASPKGNKPVNVNTQKGNKSGREHGLTMSDYENLVKQHFDRFRGYRGIVQQWIFAREVATELK